MRDQVHAKYNGHCAYCGKEITLKQMQVDHIVPLFRNDTDETLKGWGRERGTNDFDNLNPSCARCNRWKSTYTLEEFRNQIWKQLERLHNTKAGYRIALDFGLIEETHEQVKFYFEK